MSPSWQLLTILLSGAAVGSCYMLLSLGYTINARVQKFFDVSQGAAITTAVYTAWAVSVFKPPFYVVVLTASLVGAITSVAFCRIRLAAGAGFSSLEHFLAALGYLIAIEGLIGLVAGGESRVYPRQALPVIRLGLVTFSFVDVASLVLAILAVVGTAVTMARTHLGRQFRAVASSPSLARISGLPVLRIHLTAAAIGGAISGIGGLAYAWQRTANPTIGMNLIVAPLAISILAARFSWIGLGLVAFAYGELESLAFAFVPGEWKQTFVFGLLIAALISSPVTWSDLRGLRKA